MKKKAVYMSLFEMSMAGLEDSTAYSNGDKNSLVTTKHSILDETNERRINMHGQDKPKS